MAKYQLTPEQFFDNHNLYSDRMLATHEAVHRLRDELGYETLTIAACLGLHPNTIYSYLNDRQARINK